MCICIYAYFFVSMQAIPALNVVSETYATNHGLNQVNANHFGALKHQGDQTQSLLASDVDSQSDQFISSSVKSPMDGNTSIPNEVPARQNSLGLWKYLDDDSPGLGDNPSSVPQSFCPVTNERLLEINEISPEWAYSTETTKVVLLISSKLPCCLVLVSFLKCSILMGKLHSIIICSQLPKLLFLLTSKKNIVFIVYKVPLGWVVSVITPYATLTNNIYKKNILNKWSSVS